MSLCSRDLAVNLARPAVSGEQAGQPAATVERNQAAGAMAAAIAALPPPQRLAIILHRLEDLPSDDMADITASTVAAARSHLFRGRRTLTRTLAAWR
jgi:DNA-directed RNA polymerase specialized sigma24 family protein